MATVLTVEAVEGSTYVVTAAFTDEDGDLVVPNSVSWTLTESDGDVVNGRQDVSETPASSVDILLQGDDLLAKPAGGGYLLMTVTADYDSALGSGLPLIGQARIVVVELEP
jgi:hypothetical protein